jgi:enterochelin esterase-like enzyme
MNHTQVISRRTRILRQVFLCLTLLAAILCIAANGQQKKSETPAFVPPRPTPNDNLKLVEAQPNGMVTFRLYAPNAREVKLEADGPEATPGLTFAELQKNQQGIPMQRAENGVWSVSFGPIQPGIYSYGFNVDGARFADPRNPDVTCTLSSVRSLYEVPGAKFSEYNDGIPHGAIASVMYHSDATGALRRMHIYAPPGYEKNDASYPVLYLLHGATGSDDDWGTAGRAGAILDNLIAAGKAVPMTVVMPAGHITREFHFGANTTKSIGHDGFNQDLMGSVIPYVDSHYRTLSDRDHRALAGLSMGGVQTLNISLANSKSFAYVGVFSSGWFPETRETEEQTDLARYKEKGQPFKLYWVGIGKLDIAYVNSGAAVQLLKKYGIQPVTHESGGFHAWNNWRDYLDLFAPRLFH